MALKSFIIDFELNSLKITYSKTHCPSCYEAYKSKNNNLI